MNKSYLKNRQNQGGQAAVEFLISMVVIFFFLFFYLSLCVLMVASEYIDYATFMAARTFKAAYFDRSEQENNARRVFNNYVNRIEGIARNFDLQPVQLDPSDEQTWGLVASYDIDLFYLPPLFVPGERVSTIRLTSEAHLGRDPGFDECRNYFRTFLQTLSVGNVEQLIDDMEDNGC